MNGRRREDYDREDPRDEALKSIQLTIFHLGDKHPTLTPEEDLAATHRMVMEEKREFGSEILASVTTCLLEIPHKMQHYLKLVVGVNKADPVLAGKIIVDLCDTLNRSIAVGNWRHLVQGSRVLLELCASGVIAKESIDQFLQALLKHAEGNVFVRWLLLAVLPFAPEPLALWSQLGQCPVEGCHDHNDLLVLCQRLAAASWPKDIEPRISNEGTTPSQHELVPLDFDVLQVDPMWDGTYQHMNIFVDTFEPGDDASLRFCQWWNVLRLRMVLETFELNHPKLAEALLATPDETVGHPEKMVAEFLLGELLRDRVNGLRTVLYEVALMGCCRLTRLFPPVMARALLFLVQRADSLDVVQRERLASWFAHHLSNFDFKWKWEEWAHVVDLEPSNAQRLFVQTVLERLLRLSYYERVSESLPEWARALLPHSPELSYLYDEGGEVEGTELARTVLEAIQSRKSAEELKELLPPSTVSRKVFISTLLMAGAKTFSHAVILIERYLPVLQALHPKGDVDARLETISAIALFWQYSTQHFEYILERLVHYRILTAHSVLAWIFFETQQELSKEHPDFCHLALKTLSWNLVNATITQARGFPFTIQVKLQACHENDSEQRAKLEHTLQALCEERDAAVAFAKEQLAILPTSAPEPFSQAVSLMCSGMSTHI